MKITHLRIQNYKVFKDAQDVYLNPKMTIVVGANNTGKSTLLELISNPFDKDSIPQLTVTNVERSVRLYTQRGTTQNSASIPSKELIRLKLAEKILTDDFNISEHNAPGICSTDNTKVIARNPRIYAHQNHIQVESWNHNKRFLKADFEHIVERLRGNVVLLQSMRQFTAKVYSSTMALSQDGSNLAPCINNIHSNFGIDAVHDFQSLVSRIFHDVKDVSASSTPGGQYQINVKDEQGDKFKLDDWGTGTGQVLAMLYLTIAKPQPYKTIIIDEPNSFLHPSAARALIDVLREKQDDFQFIISTHSPQVISHVMETFEEFNVVTLRKENGASVISSYASGEIGNNDIIAFFKAAGANYSDLYTSRKVLWVEGPTEVEVFKIILKYIKMHTKGIAIHHVKHTGDFEQKDEKRVKSAISIYKQASETGSFPRDFLYILDKEDRDDGQAKGMKAIADQRLVFLMESLPESQGSKDVKMIEDMLIHEDAIKCTVAEMLSEHQVDINEEEIGQFIEDTISQYKKHKETNTHHAANSIHDIMRKFNLEAYGKPEIGKRLTLYLLKNDPKHLEPLVTWFTNLINQKLSEEF